MLRIGLMLHAFGDDKHLPRCYVYRAVAKIDPQIALEHNESLSGVLVVVPDKVALQLDYLELIIIHLCDDFRTPLLRKESQLLLEIDRHVVQGSVPQLACAPFSHRLGLRFCCNTFLRSRSDFGVTSTISSSAMNSMACSRFRDLTGTSRMASSALDARMLVIFFSRTTLTSRSLSRECSPTIMPSYTSTPAPRKRMPRSCRPFSE